MKVFLTPWHIAIVLIIAGILSPIFGLVITALSANADAWPHLLRTVLPKATWITLLLMIGVSLFSVLLGAGTAWLVTMYAFPGQMFFRWALIIPLAVPTYLAAFCYIEVWDYSGWVQTAIRATFGFTSARNYWFPEVRSLGGAIFVMSFVLYPYVYLTARASYIAQSTSVLEASRTLGCNAFQSFWKIGLPLARPAIAAGAVLALMECLNDIGAVEHFGVNTLTITVYDTWLERGSLAGAAQIACAMLVAVVALFSLERWSRGKQAFHQGNASRQPLKEIELAGARKWLAVAACGIPIAFGFGVPALFLVDATITFIDEAFTGTFWNHAFHSFMLALSAATIATVFGLIVVFTRRTFPSRVLTGFAVGASIGYAVPGTVLAIGVIISLSWLEATFGSLSEQVFGVTSGLFISGTAGAIIMAYIVRFFAISHGSLDSSMSKLSPHMDDAARSLGRSPIGVLQDVHLPLLTPAIGAGALLVFVDAMKELPATLLLRPFNFDTLATHVYTLASLDQFEEAAPEALMIVTIGLVPVIVLNQVISSGRWKQAS